MQIGSALGSTLGRVTRLPESCLREGAAVDDEALRSYNAMLARLAGRDRGH